MPQLSASASRQELWLVRPLVPQLPQPGAGPVRRHVEAAAAARASPLIRPKVGKSRTASLDSVQVDQAVLVPRAITGGSLSLTADGNPERDYTSISDLRCDSASAPSGWR